MLAEFALFAVCLIIDERAVGYEESTKLVACASWESEFGNLVAHLVVSYEVRVAADDEVLVV